MTTQTIHLRDVRGEDCDLLYEWANDPAARAASFSSATIPFDEHRAWFQGKLRDPHCRIFIGLDGEDTPIGLVRFDCEGAEATLSVSIGARERGKGYGSLLVRQGMHALFRETDIETIHAYAKPLNVASAKLFRHAGFEERKETTMRGQPSLHFAYGRCMLSV
jgi:UDP-2,4-diacetamido-2,4,6-trideoxy-beta-L-altropyranose hydrolase